MSNVYYVPSLKNNLTIY